jgi:hypothetical protein
MRRPPGVIALAIICFLYAGYVGGASVLMLARPTMPLTMPGAYQLPGLERAGPCWVLILGLTWALVGCGLLQLRNWARWTVMLASVWGIASGLAPALLFSTPRWWPFLLTGLQIIVRVAAVWYLFRASIADQFSKSAKTA